MDLFLAMLSGVICTIMLIWNGQLSDTIGVYASTVFIHISGLCTIVLLCKAKRIKIPFQRCIPWYLYLGGVIGVFTVFFNVLTIGVIGASFVTVLGLLGQICTSLILEEKGWLGSLQSKITKEKMISVCIILVGIGVMLL